MQFLRSEVSEFLLSPVERKQRQDLISALSTLQAAVKELHARSDNNQPNLRCREIMLNSDRAIGVLKSFVDRKFETN